MVDSDVALVIRPFRESDRSAVTALWSECGLIRPVNDPQRDIDRKLSSDPEHFVVGEVDGVVVASLMFGYEGHRGWLNYLAVKPKFQRIGLGRSLVSHAERELAALGCAKVNLQIRETNAGVVEFYRRLGYSVDEVISMGRRLVTDEHSRN